MRTAIKYPRIHITDELSTDTSGLYMLNIRGTNGSGKSTIPIQMLKRDEYTYLLTWKYNRKIKSFATVFPSFNCVAMGTYFNKTGGLDTYKNNTMTRIALELLWNLPFHIIMEGIIASTLRKTYVDLFSDFSQRKGLVRRTVAVVSIMPSIETCVNRVNLRNKGKSVKEELIAKKWKIVERNARVFEELGFKSLKLDNTHVKLEETLCWFNNCIKKELGSGIF